MLSNSTGVEIVDGLLNLQKRIAAGYSLFGTEHLIRLSVSIATWEGAPLQTLQPSDVTSSKTWQWFKTTSGLFASGVVFDTPAKSQAAAWAVAAHIWGLVNEPGLVVDVTFQDTTNGTSIDYTVQAYIDRTSGRLVIRNINLVD